MKNASAGLIALLNGNYDFLMADLWTFNLRNGFNLYYTDADINLTLAGQLYKPKDVLVTGGKLKQTRGLQVNECSVTCYPNTGAGPSLVGQTPFLPAVGNGMFDRAIVTRQRLFMPTWGDTSLGALIMFLGEITDTETTRYTAILKCKDATNLLNTYMPIRQYQPSCPWVFGDSNCTVNRTAISAVSAAAGGSTRSVIVCPLAQVAGFFNNGAIKFTSGANSGISMSIKSWSPGVATLVAPLPNPVGVGDAFTISPGCTKNYAGPTKSFNGSVSDGQSPSLIPNGLGNAGGTFNGAILLWTSGSNNGQYQPIDSWQPNLAVMQYPFTELPVIGDAFEILSDYPYNPKPTVLANSNVTSLRSAGIIPNGLSNSAGMFNGGTIQFTSGQNVGQVRTVSSWSPGLATLSAFLPYTPLVGDSFTITTAGGSTQSTCSGYNNTPNFGGQRFIPVPETAY